MPGKTAAAFATAPGRPVRPGCLREGSGPGRWPQRRGTLPGPVPHPRHAPGVHRIHAGRRGCRMSTPSDRKTELQDLLRSLSDGPLSEQESARLNQLLHGDPDLCEYYLKQFTLEAHLRHELGGPQLLREALPAFARSGADRKSPPVPGLRAAGVIRLAAAVLLGFGLSLLASSVWSRSRNEPSVRHD